MVRRRRIEHSWLVEAKRTLDFASGSGLVAIAATKAGAAAVQAPDDVLSAGALMV